jgi:hypothetical protein
MVALLFAILILVIVVAAIFYVLREFPPPEPYGKVIRVTVTVIACLFVAVMLARFAGLDTGFMRL